MTSRTLTAVASPPPEHSVFCSGAGCPGPDNCRSQTADGTIVPILAARAGDVPMVIVGSMAFRLTSALDLQFALEKAIQSVRLDINATTGETPPNSWWR